MENSAVVDAGAGELSKVEPVTREEGSECRGVTELGVGISELELEGPMSKSDRLAMEKQILFGESFPEEVWDMIFDKMDKRDLQVMENCSKASAVMDDLLTSRKTEFLFPKVLPLLLKREKKPKSLRKLLLTTRSVCRAWCEAVSTCSDFKPVTTQPTDTGYELPRRQLATRSDTKFYDHFSDTHPPKGNRSPFIGNTMQLRGPVLRCPGLRTITAMDVGLGRSVIEDYGQHIRHFYWEIHREKECIVEILKHLPNLESLSIQFANAPVDRNSWVTLRQVEQPEEDLDVDVGQLHRLKLSLQKLRFLRVANFTPIFVAALLSKTPKLTTLIVKARAVSAVDGVLVPHRARLPELKHLTLETGQGRTLGQVSDIYVPFKTLETQAGLQISTLDLFVPYTIFTGNQMALRVWAAHPLHLPHLRKLQIYARSWPCLEFVLSFRKTLEEIHVHVASHDLPDEWKSRNRVTLPEETERVEYLDSLGRMDDSSLWTLLPKLGSFSILHYESEDDFSGEKLVWKQRWSRRKTCAKVEDDKT